MDEAATCCSPAAAAATAAGTGVATDGEGDGDGEEKETVTTNTEGGPSPTKPDTHRTQKGAGLYLECLQLLRRQRIDLNLLIDYRPVTFMTLAPAFAVLCLHKAQDMLALLVTALNVEDTTATKYPIPLTFGQQQAKLLRGELWPGAEEAPYKAEDKVRVCLVSCASCVCVLCGRCEV